MRLKLISCEVFYREMATASARSPNYIEIEFLPGTLRQSGCTGLQLKLQDIIDQTEPGKYQAVLLGCGLCSKAIGGLQARSIQLVAPRHRDCLAHDGLYEPADILQQAPALALKMELRGRPQFSVDARRGSVIRSKSNKTHPRPEALAGDGARICSGLNLHSKSCAHRALWPRLPQPHELGITHFRVPGRRRTMKTSSPASCSLSLVQKLVNGYWSYEDFLVVPPGWEIAQNPDGTLCAKEKIA